jgi:hypothetical protein
MDKATNRRDSDAPPKGGRSTQRRGSNLDKLTVTQTIEVKVDASAGSRARRRVLWESLGRISGR